MSLPAGRLAVVRGDAGAGDRAGAVWRQAEADRFTYLPQIGLAIALVWTAADAWADRARRFRHGCGPSPPPCVPDDPDRLRLASDVLLARQRDALDPHAGLHFAKCRGPLQPGPCFGGGAAGSTRRWSITRRPWKSSPTTPRPTTTWASPWRSADGSTRRWHITRRPWKSSPTTPRPTTTWASLWRAQAGSTRRSAHYQKALEIKPDYAEAHINLGIALAGCGRIDEAIAHYQKALEIKPDFAEAHDNLGIALAGRGRIDEAIEHYQKALALAQQQHNAALAEALRARLRTHEAGNPHEGKALSVPHQHSGFLRVYE